MEHLEISIESQDTSKKLCLNKPSIPLISTPGMNLFPGMVVHFDAKRKKTILALETAMQDDQQVLLSTQKDPNMLDPTIEDIYSVGCLSEIKQMLKIEEQHFRVLVEIKERAEIVEVLQTEPYFKVNYAIIRCEDPNTSRSQALIEMLRNAFNTYTSMTKRMPSERKIDIDHIENADTLINVIAANLNLNEPESQQLLGAKDLESRLVIAYEFLLKEIESMKIQEDIRSKLQTEIDKQQRDYVLREQLRIIHDELEEEDDDDDDTLNPYIKKLQEQDFPEEVIKKVKDESKRLAMVPAGSSESGVIQTYLDWVLALPWRKSAEETVDVLKARKILNEDHYALEKVKERILEYISVLQLTKTLKSPIICLAGPPGVGKTSIAKSIARALNRPYIRMSLGGMRDEAEIRGHRRTYLGAIPGRLIYHIKQSGVNNPLILLDEIDKMSNDFRGDPAAALLEVLDPEQNATFTDNYLELPFDLSKVLFVTTANSIGDIPRPLYDRMEVINISGYVEDEKKEIARQFLVPKQLKVHGLKAAQCRISKKAIALMINDYTREAGVRELERTIARVCRVAAKDLVENKKKSITISGKNLQKFLGKRKYEYEVFEGKAEIGLVNGLAWTVVGGETLEIEVSIVKGKGKILITGQLGDVMKESAQTAISYVRTQIDRLGIDPDFYEKSDIHIHVPEGAVPKDGPSAGITITTAIISALTKKPVPRDLAMTGEITLRGRVLPIGGLREKLTAAKRAGITKIILPEKNEKDLEEVPESVLEALEIRPAKEMSEVIDFVFKEWS